MKLTGKCKEDFEKWCINNDNVNYKRILGVFSVALYGFWIDWRYLPQSMRYGILIDFFDSVGIYVNTMKFDNMYVGLCDQLLDKHFKTRQQARTEAIKKANEIYNTNN